MQGFLIGITPMHASLTSLNALFNSKVFTRGFQKLGKRLAFTKRSMSFSNDMPLLPSVFEED